MSVELITVIAGITAVLVALAGGFAWVIRRIDHTTENLGGRVDRVERELGGRIDHVERELGERIDRVERELGERIDRVAAEVVEVKIAVARLEGPPRRLIGVGDR